MKKVYLIKWSVFGFDSDTSESDSGIIISDGIEIYSQRKIYSKVVVAGEKDIVSNNSSGNIIENGLIDGKSFIEVFGKHQLICDYVPEWINLKIRKFGIPAVITQLCYGGAKGVRILPMLKDEKLALLTRFGYTEEESEILAKLNCKWKYELLEKFNFGYIASEYPSISSESLRDILEISGPRAISAKIIIDALNEKME